MQNLIQRRFCDASFHHFYASHYYIHFYEAKIKSSKAGRRQTLDAKIISLRPAWPRELNISLQCTKTNFGWTGRIQSIICQRMVRSYICSTYNI